MRVVYLADESAGNGYYRGHLPLTVLGRRGDMSIRRLRDDEMRCPRDADVLHIHRYCEIRALGLARDAKAGGAAVIWDNDDHQGAMPKSVVTHKHFGGLAWERRRAEIQRVFEFTDLATAPNRTLAEIHRKLGAPQVAVVENYVPDEFLDAERRPHQGTTIGWVAGMEHQMDVEGTPIRQVLQRLLDERPDVTVVTVGLRLGLRSDRYRPIKNVTLTHLAQQAAEFDIAIAPLADLDFNRSRSNVKLKEYAAAGVPWLASPIGPYADMGEKQGGRLVADDRWYEELVRLIDKPRERRKLARRAAKWARGEIVSANLSVWDEALQAAIRFSQSTAAAAV